jgi:hypothetical protein
MTLTISRIILATLSSLLFVASASADDVDLDIALADGSVAKVHISDDAGPLNSWKDVTPGIFDPATGTFTNSSNVGNARGCGVARAGSGDLNRGYKWNFRLNAA